MTRAFNLGNLVLLAINHGNQPSPPTQILQSRNIVPDASCLRCPDSCTPTWHLPDWKISPTSYDIPGRNCIFGILL